MNLTSIQEEISRLSSAERAKLIDILWESLDEAHVKDMEAKWAADPKKGLTLSIEVSCKPSTDRPHLTTFAILSENDAVSIYLGGAHGVEASNAVL